MKKLVDVDVHNLAERFINSEFPMDTSNRRDLIYALAKCIQESIEDFFSDMKADA